MWHDWHSPGWLLIAAIVIWFKALGWASDRGLEPVDVLGYETEPDERRRLWRRYVFARNIHRLCLVMLVAAAVNVWIAS